MADTWVDRFLRRNGLRVHHVKKFAIKTAEKIAGGAMKLYIYIYRTRTRTRFVIQFDEMPMSVSVWGR